MDKQQIQALVNKGAITHVGVAADLEELPNKEVCEKFITKHEVAAEVIAAEPKDPVGEPETHADEPAPMKDTRETTQSTTSTTPVEEPETPVVDETKTEETETEETEAPVVDPVENK